MGQWLQNCDWHNLGWQRYIRSPERDDTRSQVAEDLNYFPISMFGLFYTMGLQIRFCLRKVSLHTPKKVWKSLNSDDSIFFLLSNCHNHSKEKCNNVVYWALILHFSHLAKISLLCVVLFYYFAHRGIYTDDNEFQNKSNKIYSLGRIVSF